MLLVGVGACPPVAFEEYHFNIMSFSLPSLLVDMQFQSLPVFIFLTHLHVWQSVMVDVAPCDALMSIHSLLFVFCSRLSFLTGKRSGAHSVCFPQTPVEISLLLPVKLRSDFTHWTYWGLPVTGATRDLMLLLRLNKKPIWFPFHSLNFFYKGKQGVNRNKQFKKSQHQVCK